MLEHRLMGQLFRIGLAQPLLSAPHGGGVGKESVGVARRGVAVGPPANKVILTRFDRILITSYFGSMAGLDIKLIPEFDGSDGACVLEWIEKIEMVCTLSQRAGETAETRQEVIIPLRLRGGALSVYRQLPEEDRKDPQKIKSALKRAFALDKFTAYERFMDRRLYAGESVDVYVAELQQLATLFGGMSEEGLSCAFVAGLPNAVKQVLKAGARVDSLSLSELADRARAVLREESDAAAMLACTRRPVAPPSGRGGRLRGPCFSCGEAGHVARDCPRGERPGHGQRQPAPGRGGRSASARGSEFPALQCYRCRAWGHIAACCPNGEREEALAPASSRD